MFKLLCLILIMIVRAKDLPGLDYLESGFDALKMISNNEGVKSSNGFKYRLFDFSERNGQEYEFTAMNKTQKFKTPSMVRVTNVNIRNRVDVESISYTYRDFYRK